MKTFTVWCANHGLDRLVVSGVTRSQANSIIEELLDMGYDAWSEED